MHTFVVIWFHWVRDWGYPGIILLMAMESSVFPVPSELVIPPAAYWAEQGRYSLWGVVLAGVAALLLALDELVRGRQPGAAAEATPEALSAGGLDLCLFSVGTSASRELVPHAVRGGAVVIDKSDAYRLREGIPLVVAGGPKLETELDALELARSGTHLMEDRPAPLSMTELLESVRDMVRPMAEEKGLSIRLLGPEPDARLGYPLALSRTLLNLTTNAIKFTESGFVELTAQPRGPTTVELSVRDLPDSASWIVTAPRYKSRARPSLVSCRFSLRGG